VDAFPAGTPLTLHITLGSVIFAAVAVNACEFASRTEPVKGETDTPPTPGCLRRSLRSHAHEGRTWRTTRSARTVLLATPEMWPLVSVFDLRERRPPAGRNPGEALATGGEGSGASARRRVRPLSSQRYENKMVNVPLACSAAFWADRDLRCFDSPVCASQFES